MVQIPPTGNQQFHSGIPSGSWGFFKFQPGLMGCDPVPKWLGSESTQLQIRPCLISALNISKVESRLYQVHSFFLAARYPELAIGRVALRVAQGGHNVPENVIRRRLRRAGATSRVAAALHRAPARTRSCGPYKEPLCSALTERSRSAG